MSKPSQTLIAFAVLTTNWEEHQVSFFHNFLPLVAHCLAINPSTVVSEEEVQERLTVEFGIELPRPVIRTILRRAAKEGMVSRRNRVYEPIPERLVTYDVSKSRADTERGIAALVGAFQEFIRQDFGIAVSELEAEAAILDYVSDWGIPILRSSLRGEPFNPTMLSENQYEYALGQFVSRLYGGDPSLFDILITAVKGSMLASAMYLPNVAGLSRKIRDLTVYVDTPFLIALIGYAGDAQKASADELLDLLAGLGAELACFEHTLAETQNVITSAAGQLRSISRSGSGLNLFPPLVDYCLERGIGSTDLELKAERLEDLLRQHAVEVRDVPTITKELSVDELELERTLQRVVKYRNESARRNDLDSLTGVHRARRGREKRDLETAKAIFATPNGAVVKASREFFKEPQRGDRVPVAALDHELATVAWLKSPLAAPDLPTRQVVAYCYATGSPSDELWQKYLEEVERLNSDGAFSEEDYVTLRFSIEARRALMHGTLGDPDVFTSGTIAEVLERAKEEARRDTLTRLRTAEGVARSASEDARLVKDEADHLRQELAEAQSEPERVLRIGSIRLAQRAMTACMWFTLSVLILASVFSAFRFNVGPLKLVGALVAIAAAVGLVNAFTGQTVRVWFDHFVSPLANAIYRRRKRRYDALRADQ